MTTLDYDLRERMRNAGLGDELVQAVVHCITLAEEQELKAKAYGYTSSDATAIRLVVDAALGRTLTAWGLHRHLKSDA